MGQVRCHELVGRQVPWFARESSQGLVSPRDGSGNRPHLLVFCPSTGSEECRAYLEQIESDCQEYEHMQAQVIVITAERAAAASLAFPLILDAVDLFRQFGLLDDQDRPLLGVVLVDRYGVVDTCSAGASTAELPPEAVLAARLRSAESQCPECGVPEEEWASLAES